MITFTSCLQDTVTLCTVQIINVTFRGNFFFLGYNISHYSRESELVVRVTKKLKTLETTFEVVQANALV